MDQQRNAIDDYIEAFDEPIRDRLKTIRNAILQEASEAVEKISYGMPTLYQNGNLVHFAGYKNHIGFYPTPSAILAFEDELRTYHHSKGAIQFPHDSELPLDLIRRIVRFRMLENAKK